MRASLVALLCLLPFARCEAPAGSQAEASARLLKAVRDAGVAIEQDNGVFLKFLKRGKVKRHPLPESECSYHYKGQYISEGGLQEFDNSRRDKEEGQLVGDEDRRAEPVEGSPSFNEPWFAAALQSMVVGDKVELTIPPQIGYGSDGLFDPGWGKQIVPPDAAMVFTIELLKVRGGKKADL